MKKTKLIVLGSTGSIGKQTLEIVSKNLDKFEITALSAGSNINLLIEQITKFKPLAVAVKSIKDQDFLIKKFPKLIIYQAEEGLTSLVKEIDADMIVIALVGFLGLKSAIEAINKKVDLAIATKEILVAAGSLVMSLAKKNKVNIYPIDSEHSALWQCFRGYQKTDIKKIILTASGGPFFKKTINDLKKVTIKDALLHPNWQMGAKISIDSATMMNKALEIIEAFYLFDLLAEQIEALIHPQSIIHSLVEFNDTTLLAQLSKPDMRLPIQYALSKGARWQNNFDSLDLTKIKELTFFAIDFEKFPAIKLAYQALKQGGNMPTILNTANELAVNLFLSGKISFLEIVPLVAKTMQDYPKKSVESLAEIIAIDQKVREDFSI